MILYAMYRGASGGILYITAKKELSSLLIVIADLDDGNLEWRRVHIFIHNLSAHSHTMSLIASDNASN